MKKGLFLLIILLLFSTLQAQKVDFYVSDSYLYMPKSISETKTIYSEITPTYQGNDTLNIKKVFRLLTSDSLTFKSKFALGAGIRFQRVLKNKFGLTYGLGINYLTFSQSNQKGYYNEVIRTDTVKKADFNGNFTIVFNNGFNNATLFENKIDYSIFELQIPILLKYSFSNEDLFNIGINFNIPFMAKAKRTGIRNLDRLGTINSSENIVTINRNPSTIKRASTDVTLEYQKWFNHFGVAIATKYRFTNFWDLNKGNVSNDLIVFPNNYTEELIKEHSVHPIFIEIKALFRL